MLSQIRPHGIEYSMQYDQHAPPNNTRPPQQQANLQPIGSAAMLGEFIRTEHGREGVRRYLAAINPLVPHDILERIAAQLGEPAPPELRPPQPQPTPIEHDPPPKKNNMSPEQMLMFMQALNGGDGGVDPKILMQLLQKK